MLFLLQIEYDFFYWQKMSKFFSEKMKYFAVSKFFRCLRNVIFAKVFISLFIYIIYCNDIYFIIYSNYLLQRYLYNYFFILFIAKEFI